MFLRRGLRSEESVGLTVYLTSLFMGGQMWIMCVQRENKRSSGLERRRDLVRIGEERSGLVRAWFPHGSSSPTGDL